MQSPIQDPVQQQIDDPLIPRRNVESAALSVEVVSQSDRRPEGECLVLQGSMDGIKVAKPTLGEVVERPAIGRLAQRLAPMKQGLGKDPNCGFVEFGLTINILPLQWPEQPDVRQGAHKKMGASSITKSIERATEDGASSRTTSLPPDPLNFLLQSQFVQARQRQCQKQTDPAIQCHEGLPKGTRNLIRRSLHSRRIGHPPVRGHRLTRPYGTDLLRSVVANRENKVHLWRTRLRKLIPALAAHAIRTQVG